MIVTVIPVEALHEMWPKVEPFIEAAWEQSPGVYRAVDILARILEGYEVLWGVFDEENNPVGAFTTELHSFPLCRRLLVSCLGGERLNDWAEEALDVVKKYATDLGCTHLDARGRKGFRAFARKTGWKEAAVLYEYP